MALFSSKTKNEIEKLIEENDELKNTLHHVLQKHQSLNELENKLALTKGEYSETNESLQKIKNNLQTITKENSLNIEKSNVLNSSIDQLELKKIQLEEIISALESKSNSAQENLEKLEQKENQFTILENKYQTVSASLENLEEEYDSLSFKLNLLKEEENKLQSMISKHDADFETKRKDTEIELTEKLNQFKSEELKRNVIIKSLDEKISLSEEIKSNLESSLSAIIGQLSEKEKLFSEFSEKRDFLLEEVRSKQKDYDGFMVRYSFTRENIDKLEEELKSVQNKKNQVNEEIVKFEELRSSLQEKIFNLRTEEEILSERIAVSKKSIEALEKRKYELEVDHLKIESNISAVFTQFSDELDSYKNRLNLIRQEILEREKELTTKEKVFLEKATQVAEYAGLSKVLQKERIFSEQINANLKLEQKVLNEEILSLKEEINKLKFILQHMNADTEANQDRKSLLQREFKQLFNETNEEYSSLTEAKFVLLEDINSKQKEISELKGQMSEAKEQLGMLKDETRKVEIYKEECSAKVSELISMEKNLRNKVLQFEKNNEAQRNNPAD